MQRYDRMMGSSGKVFITLGIIWMIVAAILTLMWLLAPPGIEIAWQTETEFESAGFNVLRASSDQGPFVKVNDDLIPAAVDAAAGADYLFVDTDVEAGQTYYYQLEDVELSGSTIRHSLISTEAPGRPHWILALAAMLLTVGVIMLLSGRRNRPRRGLTER